MPNTSTTIHPSLLKGRGDLSVYLMPAWEKASNFKGVMSLLVAVNKMKTNLER